jgi:L-ascorbate metabolism protein UlaG (beta-lactamase superfamily)
MRGIRAARSASLALLALLGAPTARSEVRVEYLAHACFVVESPRGVRAVIDPYDGRRWLGYGFPESIRADVVLISHPHYDHDASYYWPASVPVFRQPGEYSVGDLRILGIAGRHADPHGKDFGQLNTVWLIESGGVRIAHLGDNGPPGDATLERLGRVHVLMLPADGEEHILKRPEIDAIRRRLAPQVTVPMHYRIPELSERPATLGPIEPWLSGQSDVMRLRGNQTVFSPETLIGGPRILVFRPSPDVEPWPAGLRKAWDARDRARTLLETRTKGATAAGITELRRAVGLAPEVIELTVELAVALREIGEAAEAERLLERALVGAGRGDWEYTARARSELAALYRNEGRTREAAVQYRLILQTSYRSELLDAAREFLGSLPR